MRFFEYDGINAFDYLMPMIEQTNTLSEVKSVMSVYDNYGQQIYNMQMKRNIKFIYKRYLGLV